LNPHHPLASRSDEQLFLMSGTLLELLESVSSITTQSVGYWNPLPVLPRLSETFLRASLPKRGLLESIASLLISGSSQRLNLVQYHSVIWGSNILETGLIIPHYTTLSRVSSHIS
jgi:hypothetical protein